MPEIEILLVSGVELLWMIPEGKLSMSVRLVAGQVLDGGMTPWHGVCGPMPISLEVQRTIKKKSDTLAFYGLVQMCGPSENFSDNRGSGASLE